MAVGTAPGKIILLGEHAVVYGRPALAVPVREIHVEVQVRAGPRDSAPDIRIVSPAVGMDAWLSSLPELDPIGRILRLTMNELGVAPIPLQVEIQSTIPVAAGMGSGAAVSVATVRALAAHFGRPIPVERQSALAYEVERLHHGNPSGIDNTVVAYDRPVYFRRGEGATPLRVGGEFHFVIADSGIPAPTSQAVSRVADQRRDHPEQTANLFDRIAAGVEQGRSLIERGSGEELGKVMDRNHDWLAELGVSSAALDRLAATARAAGAWGAKLSGGGLGGNVVALVPEGQTSQVSQALEAAGAVQTLHTRLSP